jgi:hypothetical protein
MGKRFRTDVQEMGEVCTRPVSGLSIYPSMPHPAVLALEVLLPAETAFP